MTDKPTYEELKHRVKELEKEADKRKSIEERLKHQKETMQALMNAPTETAILTDLEGTILAVNEIAAQRIGKSSEELIGLEIFNYLPRDIARSRKAKADEVVRAGTSVRFQDERDGRSYDNNIYPVFDAEEKVTALAIYARDITEAKRAEEALRESEEKYRRLAENSPDMIYRMSLPDGKYQYVSSAATAIFGYPPEAWYDNPLLISEIIHADWQPFFKDQWNRLLKGDVPPTYEYQIVHKDGSIRWLNQRNVLVSGEDGRPVAIEGIVTDITERKWAEEALRESESLYRSLFKNNHSVMLVINPKNGDIVDANPAAISYYGWSHEEFTTKKITDINMLTKEQIFQEMEMAKSEQRRHFIFRHRLSNGGNRDVEVYSGPIKLHGHDLLYSIIHDITDRKQVEEEREKLINGLQEALKEIKTLRGILPLCSFCKKIRDDKGYWEQVDVYIYKYSEADISHSICPECAKEHYPDLDI